VVALAGVALFVATGGAQQPGERTFTLTERGGTFNFVDNPPKSKGQTERTFTSSVGDMLAFSTPLYDEANARAGTAHVSCVVTRGGKGPRVSYQCNGTFVLKDGSIAVDAAFVEAEGGNITVAITGGTGAYEGANGTIISRDGPNDTSVDTVHLLP
jgi:hypothetical protein